jgi:acetyltransferase-like isoleucine patch superfamily enzyme
MYQVSIPRGTRIGNNVFLGPGATILNDKYPPSANKAPVIKDEAVIGGRAVLLPDITVGYRAVVGGGSVVTKDVPDEVVVVGNPARIIMTRSEYDRKQREWIKYCPKRK